MVDFKRLLEKRREDQGEKSPYHNRPPVMHKIKIQIAGSDYAVKFDRSLLDIFKKAVPEHQRRWIAHRYVWLVSPEAIDLARGAFEQYLQTTIPLPVMPVNQQPQLIGRTFLLEYLGQTKDRGNKRSAFGFTHNDWSVEFPEDVLRNFFEGRENGKPAGNIQTLYQVLCVFEKVDSEAIKKAYKRLALHHHPDTCKEDGAHEMFIKINEAYKVLIDPQQRQRYDAGLYFERQGSDQSRKPKQSIDKYGYRSPLRCGNVTAIGTVRLMRFVVSEITAWEDEINSDGKVMTSTWDAGAEKFQVLWV